MRWFPLALVILLVVLCIGLGIASHSLGSALVMAVVVLLIGHFGFDVFRNSDQPWT